MSSFTHYHHVITNLINFFLSRNTKGDVLNNVHTVNETEWGHSAINISFFVPQLKVSHTGFKRHGKYLGELFL